MTDDANAKGLKLLVVEDEALIAMMMEDMLLELGASEVVVVAKVNQALAVIGSRTFDGAFLDVNLGGGEQSYPIAEELIARNIPFAFVTGYGAKGVHERFASVKVLQKPFALRQLKNFLFDSIASEGGAELTAH